MATANGSKASVSTSTLNTNTTIPQSIQDEIYSGLLTTNAPRRIESVIRDELDRASYLDKVRNRATYLFRSGRAKTFKEAMDIIMAEIRDASDGSAANGAHAMNGVNGAGSSLVTGAQNGDEPMGKLPAPAIEAGRRVIRTEVEAVVDVEVDDE